MNKNEMTTTALQLKALLTVIAAVDPDNIEALAAIVSHRTRASY